MNKDLFDRIVDALLPHMDDPAARKALVESTLFGSSALHKIQWDGAADTFTGRLVSQLDKYGDIAAGKPALVALLEELRGQVGPDRKRQIDELIAALQAPPAVVSSEPVGFPDLSGTIFISYQRDSEEEALQVNGYLQSAGWTVWQDVKKIRHTDLWPLAVHEALATCERLVILLTPKAMASREVFNEWFYFYSKRKPIHCLLLLDCEIHYQLLPYQYLDWRNASRRDWPRLLREMGQSQTAPGDGDIIVDSPHAPERPLPDALEALKTAILNREKLALTPRQIQDIANHKPANLSEYPLVRIAEWSQPRYALDNRFVRLTLMFDNRGKGEGEAWLEHKEQTYNDLREILEERTGETAFVLLGEPGGGKSTLLRRLQLDDAVDNLRRNDDRVSFFVPLSAYRAERSGTPPPPPQEWLAQRWNTAYPDLPRFHELLQAGRLLLLLDALNEMPHADDLDYAARVDDWQTFIQQMKLAHSRNRAIFSCRSLQYSGGLSTNEIPVPHINLQRMTPNQVQEFLNLYLPEQELAARTWERLRDTPQLEVYRTPFYLKLLVDMVAQTGDVPEGRAGLFTAFVRRMLAREKDSKNPLFKADGLLDADDLRQIEHADWRDAYELPRGGCLIERLAHLAYAMQELHGQGHAQVRLPERDARKLLTHPQEGAIVQAGLDLTVLDKQQRDIQFFHQLLQEYFAARRLAEQPRPELAEIAWRVGETRPSLEEHLATLADNEPIQLLDTRWEETTLTAAPMAADPDTFIHDLMMPNLPLAARCAAAPEVSVNPDLKREIQQALIARTQDMQADLRARIAAGLALGDLGDPRFERRTGAHGDYLLPPLVAVPAGTYPMGDDDSGYDFEKPAHTVELATFQIGLFPVTNAEYALFIEAGGYEDEQWWETENAQAWRRGEGSTEGQKKSDRELHQTLQSWSDEDVNGLVKQNRVTTEQAEWYIWFKGLDQDKLEERLEAWYPAGKTYREPEYWNDTRFNNPAQPVVGITWFEARAYCKWLSAQTGQVFDLPTEAQFEAAARGETGRNYPYGPTFEVSRSNTFESHIRRTTPVGIFANATPEGAFDLSGNAYTWTLSIYDQEQFRYPYRADDGRENIRSNARRVLRGGSWSGSYVAARAAARNDADPFNRSSYNGFRVCRPPSKR